MDGVRIVGRELETVVRHLLREALWCRLEDDAGRYIHVGYDYYMYLGVDRNCPESEALAKRRGLFVEEFRSPYLGKSDDGTEDR